MLKSAPITLQPFEVQQAVQLAPSPDVDGYVVSLSADVSISPATPSRWAA